MRVLVACEYSGRVREAFRKLGHDAWSCDLLPADDGSEFHLQCDVLSVLKGQEQNTYKGILFGELSSVDKEKVNLGILEPDIKPWDAMIAHPPCTYLCRAGWHWVNKPDSEELPLKGEPRRRAAQAAREFFLALLNSDIPRIAVENPRPIFHVNLPPSSQSIQPWQFGHGEVKETHLWLKNLPALRPTNIVSERKANIHKMPPGKLRSKLRSLTYQGIADAMAQQWGGLV